ncbi:MAG: immunity protein Tsi6 family protein [Pirellula sp.]
MLETLEEFKTELAKTLTLLHELLRDLPQYSVYQSIDAQLTWLEEAARFEDPRKNKNLPLFTFGLLAVRELDISADPKVRALATSLHELSYFLDKA